MYKTISLISWKYFRLFVPTTEKNTEYRIMKNVKISYDVFKFRLKNEFQDAFDEFYKPYLYHWILIYLILNDVYFRGRKITITHIKRRSVRLSRAARFFIGKTFFLKKVNICTGVVTFCFTVRLLGCRWCSEVCR